MRPAISPASSASVRLSPDATLTAPLASARHDRRKRGARILHGDEVARQLAVAAARLAPLLQRERNRGHEAGRMLAGPEQMEHARPGEACTPVGANRAASRRCVQSLATP